MKGVIDRMPLRVRLVVASTVLVAAGLAISGFVAAATLRGYLVNRVDDQLRQASQHYGGPGFGNTPPFGGGGPHDDGAPTEIYAAYYNVNGRLAYSVVPAYGPASEQSPQLPDNVSTATLENDSQPFTVGSSTGSGSWRVIARPAVGGGAVYVAQSLSDVDHTVGRLQLLELLIGLGVVTVLAGAGYVVVRRSLRPLTEVESTAEAIADGDLSRRIPPAHPGTEVGRLSNALNGMLAQIERAFHVQQESEQAARRSEQQMRQFVADASHELRTPLTSIRGFSELYRQGAVSDADEVAHAMRRIEDEASRMGVLVDDLLLLARLDQRRPLQQQPVDMNRLAAEAAEDAHVVAPERTVSFEGVDGDAVVIGDELRLRQVLGNLLGNALTHTPDGTPIAVRVDTQSDPSGAWVVLEVADEGPGLPPEHAERVFERFYRVDAARTRGQGGTGLGLSIVAGLTEAHGGRVELDTRPGEGATFRVLLPAAAPDLSGPAHAMATPASDKS